MLTLSPVDQNVLSLMAEKESVFVPRSELIADLWTVKGARIMSVVTVTEPKLKKSVPLSLANAVKVAYSLIRVGTDYENSVNNQREREGAEADFVGKASWHQPVKNPNGGYTPFCEHKQNGDWYLRCVLDKVIASRYIDRNTGAEIAAAELEPYLPAKRDYGANQGVDKAVVFLTYKLDSIAGFNANGKSAIVVAG